MARFGRKTEPATAAEEAVETTVPVTEAPPEPETKPLITELPVEVPPAPGPPAGSDLPPELPPAPAEGAELRPMPVADPHGPVPRVIKAFERVAPDSRLTRFKVGCRNYGSNPDEYVLARDQDAAVSHYLEHTGIAQALRTLEQQGNKPERPAVFVKPMPD
jgi:hypothetical protein